MLILNEDGSLYRDGAGIFKHNPAPFQVLTPRDHAVLIKSLVDAKRNGTSSCRLSPLFPVEIYPPGKKKQAEIHIIKTCDLRYILHVWRVAPQRKTQTPKQFRDSMASFHKHYIDNNLTIFKSNIPELVGTFIDEHLTPTQLRLFEQSFDICFKYGKPQTIQICRGANLMMSHLVCGNNCVIAYSMLVDDVLRKEAIVRVLKRAASRDLKKNMLTSAGSLCKYNRG